MEQAAAGGQGVVGVVVLQNLKDAHALPRQPLLCPAVHEAAGGVGGAVGAVAAQREHGCVLQPGDAGGGGEGQLLVAPAQAGAGQVHHGLPPGQEGQGAVRILVGTGYGGQEGPRLPGLAVQAVGEQHRLIAQLPAGRGCGGAQLPHAAGDKGLHIVQNLGRLPLQALGGLGRQAQAVLLRDAAGIGTGGGVGVGRAGGDHVQRIADDIRQDDGEYLCRGAVLGKPPALDGGEPLADGVHLHDVRPAGQKALGDGLELLLGDQRRLEEGGAAAGEEKEDGVLRRQAVREGQRLLRGGKGVLVGDGMPRLPDEQGADGALGMAVLGDDDAAVQPPPHAVAGGAGHRPGGLAHGHQHHPAALKGVPLQGAANRRVGLDSGDGPADNLITVVSQFHAFLHGRLAERLKSGRPQTWCGGSPPWRGPPGWGGWAGRARPHPGRGARPCPWPPRGNWRDPWPDGRG